MSIIAPDRAGEEVEFILSFARVPVRSLDGGGNGRIGG